jgi:transcription elongation factor S-II
MTTPETLPKLREINDKIKLLSEDPLKNEEEIIKLISSLEKIPCTPAELKTSQLNVVISSMRKCPNEKIVNSVKSIISHWKSSSVPSTAIAPSPIGNQSNSNVSTDITPTHGDDNTLVQIPPPQPVNIDAIRQSGENNSNINDDNGDNGVNKKRPLQQAFILGQTGNKTRDSIQKLFYSVFDLETLDLQLRCELAITIEEALFNHYLSDNQDYKDRSRLLLANLRDVKNTDFRESLIDGYIEPKSLPTLTQAEMSSKQVQKALAETADYQLQSRKTDLGGGQGVDMFPCPKCKGRNTSFFQKQTRSADEPMTIFCTCLLCRQKWRIY